MMLVLEMAEVKEVDAVDGPSAKAQAKEENIKLKKHEKSRSCCSL